MSKERLKKLLWYLDNWYDLNARGEFYDNASWEDLVILKRYGLIQISDSDSELIEPIF